MRLSTHASLTPAESSHVPLHQGCMGPPWNSVQKHSFFKEIEEGGAPGEENKNLLEGRWARASYLIRGSTLSSLLHNFESHSSGDQERCNEFTFKFFFFFNCVLIWKTETLDYGGNVIQGGSQSKPVFQRNSRLPNIQGQMGKTRHSSQDDLCQL